MRIERTNFAGSWDDICPHCGAAQESHKITLGEYDGVLYEHRLPCDPEKAKMAKERTDLVNMAHKLVVGIYTVEYVADKIKGLVPFWDEVMLLRKIIPIISKRKKAEPAPPHEAPPRASVSDAPDDRTLDSLPAPGSSGGRYHP